MIHEEAHVIQEKLRLLNKAASLSLSGRYEEARKAREHCKEVNSASAIESLRVKFGEQK